MLRSKLSFGLLRPKEGEAAPTPSRSRRFFSEQPPRPPSPLDFSDGPVQRDTFSLGHRLEALDLEPLVRPFLQRVAPMIMTPEQAALDITPPRQRHQSLGDMLRSTLGRRASADLDAACASSGLPALIDRAFPLSTPSEERENPFDDPYQNHQVTIIPFPKRPELQRRAVSARSRRDIPLRVQAIRRSHQQAFAMALAAHIEQQMGVQPLSPEQPPTVSPSSLWARRRRSSPEDGPMPPSSMHLDFRGGSDTIYEQEETPPLFSYMSPQGEELPYRLDGGFPQTPPHSYPSPYEEGPDGERIEAYGPPQVYRDRDGRTWL